MRTIFRDRTLARFAVALLVGGAAAVALALVRWGELAPLGGWTVTGVVFLVWTWLIIWPMSGDDTRTHSQREDPSRSISQVVIMAAALMSIAGVVLLLWTGKDERVVPHALVAFAAVGVSWLMIHTLYTLHYARLWYADEDHPCVDWNEDDGYEPPYSDFAYLSFDLGMTFQVSDTDVRTARLRRVITGHTLLSWVFSTVILASTINVVLSLAS